MEAIDTAEGPTTERGTMYRKTKNSGTGQIRKLFRKMREECSLANEQHNIT